MLFEMLTGRAAFAAETVSDTIARVLESEPDWQALPPSTPVRLCDLIRRCLQKDANRRQRDIGDARIELGEASKAPAVPTGELSIRAVLRSGTRVRTLVIALAAAAALALAGAAAVLWRSVSLPEGMATAAARHTQVTFSGNVRDAALSPDGRTIAYVTDEGDQQRLMVQDLAGGPALELSRGRRLALPPWSPDGSRLSVFAGTIVVVSRFGGQTRVAGRGAFSSWSPDGSRVAVALSDEQGFRVLDLAGGESRSVPMSGFRWLTDLDWSRRSDRLAILTKDDRGTYLIWTASPDGAEIRRVYSDKDQLVSPRWSPAGLRTGTIERSGDVIPDGRHVICSVNEYKGDAWLIENFDPSLRLKAR